MLKADLHTHTNFSHAADSMADMYAAAGAKGLEVFGFSEHSPRPPGYVYAKDYQDKLLRGFNLYLDEALALKQRNAPGFTVLLGLEADFIPAELAFTRELIQSAPLDYVIGGLHFQDKWGFDARAEDWAALSRAGRFACYARYYEDLALLCASNIADIVAHPDMIKIFSRQSFDAWLEQPASLQLVNDVLKEIKKHGLLLELSSAGLRKPCREPYPGPKIMALAADLGLRLCISSDAHSVGQIAHAFAELESYARSFGFSEYYIIENRRPRGLAF